MENPTPKPTIMNYKGSEILRHDGLSYLEFRKTLMPHFSTVWKQLSFGYLSIVGLVIVCETLLLTFPNLKLVVIFLTAISFGYAFAFIILFLHEAAHFGLSSNKKWNDLLGTIFVGLLVGTTVGAYRKSHLQHHQFLGKINDPENSYFNALSIRFLASSLFLYRAFQVFFKKSKATDETQITKRRSLWPISLGIIIHSTFIFGLSLEGQWRVAIAWILGVGIFFPFFASLRQLLEHRSEAAFSQIDYTQENHGAFSRMFGDGPIASSFGGAGFNRHSLHHWDLTVPCSRLKEVEIFLLESNVAGLVESSRTTYLKTFKELFIFE